MRNKGTKLTTGIVIALILILLFVSKALAFGGYVDDGANVLSANIEKKLNDNFAKLEKNTGARARIVSVKSLNGKSIEDLAIKASKDAGSDKYAVFVFSINEKKKKFIYGPGVNAAFSSQEADLINGLPNDFFGQGDYDNGVLRVGQAIDQRITTKAVKSGTAVVKSNGISTTVEKKKSYTGLIIFLIILIAAIAAIIVYIKKKNEKEAREFARRNSLDYDKAIGSNKGFKSAALGEKSYTPPPADREAKVSYSVPPRERENVGVVVEHDHSTQPSRSYSERKHEDYNYRSGHSVIRPVEHHTTVINNHNDNNDLVTGMMLGHMMSESHESHHHEPVHHEPVKETYTPSSHSNDDDTKYSSGNWGSSETSSWGNSDSSPSWGDSGGSSDGGCSSGDW